MRLLTGSVDFSLRVIDVPSPGRLVDEADEVGSSFFTGDEVKACFPGTGEPAPYVTFILGCFITREQQKGWRAISQCDNTISLNPIERVCSGVGLLIITLACENAITVCCVTVTDLVGLQHATTLHIYQTNGASPLQIAP